MSLIDEFEAATRMARDSVGVLLETIEALRRRVIDLERERDELIQELDDCLYRR